MYIKAQILLPTLGFTLEFKANLRYQGLELQALLT